jgi:Ca-activated chloride channel family protein
MINHTLSSNQLFTSPRFFFATTGLSIFFNLLLISWLLLNSIDATADAITETDVVENIGELGQGTLLFKYLNQYKKAPQLTIDVRMKITGMINRVTVIQTFSNTTDAWQEGIYVFPLPENAAVDQLRLRVGERIVEGQIKEKQEAKKTYQQAIKQGKKAALTEQERPNVFTTSVANIAPHETVTVEIEYQQIVHYDNAAFSIRFPMVVGPRYIPGQQRINGFAGTGWALNTDQVPDATRITPPVIAPGSDRKNKVSIRIDLDAGLQLDKIYSPYHAIQIDEQAHRYQIQLKQELTLANKDFELIWLPHTSDAPKAALFTEKVNGETYALIMMIPPTVKKTESLNREIIYVIDTSGSMGGQSIIQARAALELALTRLKPGDRFNIIQFNSWTAKLFSRSELVSPASLEQALHYVRSLEASGGTEMATALHAALANQGEHESLRQIIFITDGSIGNEQVLFDIIQMELGQSRLFTVGIGSAPNSHFMQRAATFGRGTHSYIGKLDEVQTRMQSLFEKIENPILKDIHVDWGQVNKQTNNSAVNIDHWPQKIPDLYQGEPLLITAKVDALPDTILISGHVAKQDWNATLNLSGGQNRPGIATLWARNKIAALMQQKRDAEFESTKQVIIATALKHHLVSQYTSLVAVDVTPSRPLDKNINTNAIPTHLPAGWDHTKVFGQPFPATATDARINFIIGLVLMFISVLLYLCRRRETCI